MAANHLESLVAEWYEFNGFFVRRNVQVGRRKAGGYECELDVVGFHPKLHKLVQIEPSLDADSWAVREKRYLKKFEAGQKYIRSLFEGIELPASIDQVAIFVFSGRDTRRQIAGGTILSFDRFMNDIYEFVRKRPLNNAMIPELFPLLRSLQFAARTWTVA